jgi:hypothetical protein
LLEEMDTEPDPELTLLPVLMDTNPPTVPILDEPEDSATLLATPESPLPATILMLPLRPPVEEPVPNDSQPLLPDFDEPLLMDIAPDTPRDSTFAVCINTDPEPELELLPLNMVIEPPVPLPSAAPPDAVISPPLPAAELI